MEPGELRHKIDIQQSIPDQDDRGGVVERWVDLFLDIWAEVLYLQGRDLWQAQQVNAEVNMKVRIRYRPGLTSTCRVKWKRERGSPTAIDYLEVVGPPIEVEGRQNEIWLMCIRRDAEGFRTGEKT